MNPDEINQDCFRKYMWRGIDSIGTEPNKKCSRWQWVMEILVALGLAKYN